MKARHWMAVVTIAALFSAPFSFAADERFGIFEEILVADVSFDEANAALEMALIASGLELHATHDVRVPDDKQQARVYVLTSPTYLAAAAGESSRTVSAQVLRMAVYTAGEEQGTFINMANPVAHAMLFYAKSRNYDELVAAAGAAAEEIRQVAAQVPGEAVSVQREPMRTEKHYNKYKGDGPARMMTKFRTYVKSQRTIYEGSEEEFDQIVSDVREAVANSEVANAEDSHGWEPVAVIRLSDDVVYVGLTNPYIEDRMIRINSRHRKDGKSEASPYPGVDHVTALPTEVLIVREDGETKVLHYGQMWRMQLYFWDSGYRAFTANVGVPGAIGKSIERTVDED